MCSVSTPARNFVKSRLAVRMPFIAPCSLQIHPSRSCPIGGRPNVSQDESAYMKAHTRSPVSTRRPSHTACSKSPYTDNGDGVGANTSSLTVVAKSFSTHLDLTSLPFIRRAQPVSRIRLVGRNVCLFDPGVRQEKRTDYHVQNFKKGRCQRRNVSNYWHVPECGSSRTIRSGGAVSQPVMLFPLARLATEQEMFLNAL